MMIQTGVMLVVTRSPAPITTMARWMADGVACGVSRTAVTIIKPQDATTIPVHALCSAAD